MHILIQIILPGFILGIITTPAANWWLLNALVAFTFSALGMGWELLKGKRIAALMRSELQNEGREPEFIERVIFQASIGNFIYRFQLVPFLRASLVIAVFIWIIAAAVFGVKLLLT